MQPLSLILMVVLSISLLPGLFAAPYDHSDEALLQDIEAICELFPCASVQCPEQHAGLRKCTSEEVAQETFMVAQTQQAVKDICDAFECTPLGCGTWPPDNLEYCLSLQPQNQVEKQGQRHGDNLRPPNKLLHLLTNPRKPTYYDITFDVDNQIIDKGSQQEKLLDKLLSIRRSGKKYNV